MPRVRTAFVWIVVATHVVWLSAELPLWLGGPAARQLGDAFMQGTGVLAIVLMSLSLVLAARPRIVERWMNGLDKMYRLHKWLSSAWLSAAQSRRPARGRRGLPIATCRRPAPDIPACSRRRSPECGRPPVRQSDTKSRLQRSLGHEGSPSGARTPKALLRPPRFLTAKPSSR